MPGLLRGMARTAVVAGTATAVSNRVSRRQYGRWAEQESADAYEQQPQQPQYAAPPPAPAAPSSDDRIGELRKLAELRDSGVLTEDEFAAEKAKILNS
jgi:hypothetical protein